jgi:hypothetical protein
MSITTAGCILPNVKTAAKKRLDMFLQETRIFESQQPHLENEWCTDPSLSLQLPMQNEQYAASHTPLLEFRDGKTLTIIPGLFSQLEVSRNAIIPEPLNLISCRSTLVQIRWWPCSRCWTMRSIFQLLSPRRCEDHVGRYG